MPAPESAAVAVARAHVEAWARHDFDAVRACLTEDVHVVTTTVDPEAPLVDTTGADVYMEGLIRFAQGVLPGTTEVTWEVGDDTHAMLGVTSRVKFGPDAPELTLYGARVYLLGANRKIAEERVAFVVLPA
jgi:hypothetical protein